VPEPGLDQQEWETEWRGLEPLLIDSPAEALPEVDRLIERLLIARGYPTTEEGARDDPSAVSAAITGYRNLYEFLLSPS